MLREWSTDVFNTTMCEKPGIHGISIHEEFRMKYIYPIVSETRKEVSFGSGVWENFLLWQTLFQVIFTRPFKMVKYYQTQHLRSVLWDMISDVLSWPWPPYVVDDGKNLSSCLHLLNARITDFMLSWFYTVLVIEHRASCMLGKHSTNWVDLCAFYVNYTSKEKHVY